MGRPRGDRYEEALKYRTSENGKRTRAENNRKRADHHRARLAAAKAGGCVDCGRFADEPVFLVFHHVDPATKLRGIGEMMNRPDEAFYAELAKCVLVCLACHVKRHEALRLVSS